MRYIENSCFAASSKINNFNFHIAQGFGGVVVITSALHAEGPGFNPRSNLGFVLHS